MTRWVTVRQTDANMWELVEPYRFASEDGTVFGTVPTGYKTDFATVPRLLWWLFPRYGSYTAAAVVHDWLLTDCPDVSSRDADRYFREALRALDVSGPMRWLAWAGVRWGALFNKRRRAGSLATFPGVLLVSVLALPIVLPALALVPSLLVFGLLERMWP